MQKQSSVLALIAVLIIAAIAVLLTFPLRLGLDLQGGAQITIQVKTTQEVQEITPKLLEAVEFVVRNRVDALGVSEPLVQTVGKDQILVQLPGVSDPEEAERVLGGTAQLEFRRESAEVKAQFNVRLQELQQLQVKQQELLSQGNAEAIAQNQAALEQKEKQLKALSDKLYEPLGLTGRNLKDALAITNQVGNWEVEIRFDTEGGEKFAELTKSIAGTGRTIGIFLDEQLISSPIVGPEHAATGITGGNAVIQGNFTAQQAQDMEKQLRGGSLPVPVEIVENRTVGATLGQDSIKSSLYAGIGGLLLVLIFMGVYYRVPGLIADVSLVIYSILTLASFALLGVTLSLPGIAGFILSIGMAVDANVLIFERTREELRAGKSLYRSVESGFYRAFSSILDGNVTTVIACAALFWLGSGLVRGFALTLGLGVAVSMFTALTCSRTFLLVAIAFPELRKPEFYCPNLPGATKKAEAA